MGMIRRSASLAIAAISAAFIVQYARAEESDASREARWHDVAAAIFRGRQLQDGSGTVQIDAPPRALDAALVPVTITVADSAKITALYLVIDDNPAPVAGAFHFGPLADPHVLKTRVRVDQYTLMHAVAETSDGRLLSVARFIKAAGGCSAPGTSNTAEAMARLGRMKLIVRDASVAPATTTAELLISHPNANGMQMDPVSRLYTPARYVQTVKVSEGGQMIFTMDGDISLSQDPAITFGFKQTAAKLDVEVDDSAKAVFRQSFRFRLRGVEVGWDEAIPPKPPSLLFSLRGFSRHTVNWLLPAPS